MYLYKETFYLCDCKNLKSGFFYSTYNPQILNAFTLKGSLCLHGSELRRQRGRRRRAILVFIFLCFRPLSSRKNKVWAAELQTQTAAVCSRHAEEPTARDSGVSALYYHPSLLQERRGRTVLRKKGTTTQEQLNLKFGVCVCALYARTARTV